MNSGQGRLPKQISIPQALRPIEPRDVSQAEEIEREAFPTSWPPTPFKRDLTSQLARCLVAWSPGIWYPGTSKSLDHSIQPQTRFQKLLHQVQSFIYRRSETSNQQSPELITGYVNILCIADEAHITGIAVRQLYHRYGIGELLMLGSLELALSKHCRTAILEVRVSNTAAQALYRKYGFHCRSIRKGYYSDNQEDAFVMTTDQLNTSVSRRRLWELTQAYVQRYGEPQRFYY